MASELRIVLGKLKRRLREHANKGDMSLSQMAVLGYLDREGPSTVTTLARAEGVRSQSMGATVAALEEGRARNRCAESRRRPADHAVLDREGA